MIPVIAEKVIGSRLNELDRAKLDSLL